MGDPRRLSIGLGLLVLVGGCNRTNQAPPGSTTGTLVVTPAGSKALEAKYGEGGAQVTLRARLDGAGVVSDIYDEGGRSVTALAVAVATRPGSSGAAPAWARDRSGARQLVDRAARVMSYASLAQHALDQLRGLPPVGNEAFLADLSRQITTTRTVVTSLRLTVLQSWASEVARVLQMTPDERAQFFAVFRRQARAVAMATAKSIRGSSKDAGNELAALLGQQRYATYVTHRNTWFGPVLAQAREVLP